MVFQVETQSPQQLAVVGIELQKYNCRTIVDDNDVHLCLCWNSAQSLVVLYMNLMIAYSVQMDQVMESFNSGHTFSIVHIADAK